MLFLTRLPSSPFCSVSLQSSLSHMTVRRGRPWNEERNCTEDLKEPPVPPQQKQEELCGARLVPKQEPDGLASTPARRESDESEGQALDRNPGETVNMPVLSSAVSARDLEAEPNPLQQRSNGPPDHVDGRDLLEMYTGRRSFICDTWERMSKSFSH